MKQKTFGAVLTALLLGAAILPASASAEAWLTLDKFSGPPTTLQVSGGGFEGGETIRLQAGGATAEARATEWGGFGPVPLAVPLNTPQGPLAVTGTGSSSGATAGNSYYVVQFTPSFSVTEALTHAPGGQIRIAGSGFAPNEQVTATLGAGGSTFGADDSGAFSALFTIPFNPAGTYEFAAQGNSSGARAVTWYYVGGFYPSIQPSAYYLEPDGTLSFSGGGFAPGEEIRVTTEGMTEPAAVFPADASGRFSAAGSFRVPFEFAGQMKTFTARGASSNASTSVTIAVGRLYPSLIPSEYYAVPGSTIVFSGRGFAPAERVNIYDGTAAAPVASAMTEGGAFSSSTFTVPYSIAGTSRTFRAVGERSGAEGSVGVTIGALYPNVMPSSYYVPAGYSFTVSGTGFAPNEEVTFAIAGASSTVRATANSFGNFFLAGPFRAPVAAGTAAVRATGATSGAGAEVVITVGRLYPTVSPSEYWLMPLQNFEFRASGFVPEENVRITSGTSTLATVQANAFGNFVRVMVAPARAGGMEFVFTGESSGAEARVNVTVAGLYATVTAQNYYVAPGDGTFVQGSGFLNNEPVRIELGGRLVATVNANGVGNVPPTPVMMPIASGTVEARMTGTLSGATAATSISLVPFSPQVTPSTWYASGGSPISFTGRGFAPGEEIAVSLNGTSTATTTADSAGAMSLAGLRLPFASSARYSFAGSTSGAQTSVDITIAAIHPWMSLDTYYAAPGMPLTVFGRGFASGEAVSIAADGTPFASATADDNGNFDLATRVPQAPVGDRAIRGTGGLSDASGTTGMTIAPAYLDLQLERYAVPPGGTVRFTGGGYVPGEPIEVRTDRTGEAVQHTFAADASGRFDDSGYAIPAGFAEGNLTLTVQGAYSLSPKTITIYVTGG